MLIKKSCDMIVNKTTTHRRSNKVDESNCRQPYGLNNEKPHTVKKNLSYDPLSKRQTKIKCNHLKQKFINVV